MNQDLSHNISIYLTIGLGFFFLCYRIGNRYRYVASNFEEYVAAGRRLGTFSSVCTILATWFGAGAMIGTASEVYHHGIRSVISDPFGITAGLLFLSFFLVPKFRKDRDLTVSDAIARKFGRKYATFLSLLMLPLFIGTIASQFIAFGTICQKTLGFNRELCSAFIAVVTIAIIQRGGLWAVVVTDILQLKVIGIAIVVCTVFVIQLADGSLLISDLKDEVSNLFTMGSNDPILRCGYLGQWFMAGIGAILAQDLFQRISSAKSDAVAQKSSFIAACLYLMLGLGPILIGLSARHMGLVLQHPDDVFLEVVRQNLSEHVYILFVFGLVAAIMSTADSYLLAGAVLLARNVLESYVIREKTEQIALVKASSVIITALALLVGCFFPRIFGLIVFSYTTLFVGAWVPTMAAFLMEKPSLKAAMTATFSGLVSWLIALIYTKALGYNLDQMIYAASFIGGLVALIGFVSVEGGSRLLCKLQLWTKQTRVKTP